LPGLNSPKLALPSSPDLASPIILFSESLILNVASDKTSLSALTFVTSTGILVKGSFPIFRVTPLSDEVDRPIAF